MTTTRKKLLFVGLLGAAGVAAALVLSAVLVQAGVLRFGWTERWQVRRQMARAADLPDRVLVLGDSFPTWWPIQPCLNLSLQHWGEAEGVGMLIRAWGGFGPTDYRDQFDLVAPGYRPGLVVLFTYAGNDISDMLHHPPGEPIRPEALPVPDFSRPEAARRGWSLGLVPEAEAAPAEPADAPEVAPEPDPAFDWEAMRAAGIPERYIRMGQRRLEAPPNTVLLDSLNPYLLTAAMHQPELVRMNLAIDTDEARWAWSLAEEQLRAIAAGCRELGAELVLVSLPSPLQVSRPHQAFFRALTFEVPEALLESRVPQDRLAALCRELDVALVDLLPSFRALERPGDYFWPNDDHFNEAGHALAFGVVCRQVLDVFAARRPPAPGS